MNAMELVHLVTEAYDHAFIEGYRFSDYGGYEEYEQERLTDPDYIGKRDDWIRARIPEGTTVA